MLIEIRLLLLLGELRMELLVGRVEFGESSLEFLDLSSGRSGCGCSGGLRLVGNERVGVLAAGKRGAENQGERQRPGRPWRRRAPASGNSGAGGKRDHRRAAWEQGKHQRGGGMVPPRRQPIKIDWGRWEGQDRGDPCRRKARYGSWKVNGGRRRGRPRTRRDDTAGSSTSV